jgi:predicted ATPase/DNA-binding XRE family transcriptional regulator
MGMGHDTTCIIKRFLHSYFGKTTHEVFAVVYDGAHFGRWVRKQRKARDMTQRALAEEIGCSEFTLRKFEGGTRRPSRQIVERLAQFFETPVDETERVMRWARLGGQELRTASEQPGYVQISSTQTPPNNLPYRLTRLIGRERELAQVTDFLLRDDLRLLTLVGPPGVGKTRLALQVAWNMLAHFNDGVFFVSLALARDVPILFATIAQALGQRQPGSEDALSDVAQALSNKRMLLVLDNFEQLLKPTSRQSSAEQEPHASTTALAVVRLLESCPHLKVLVTSREELFVHGEQQFVVPTLALPDVTTSFDRLLDFPSVALFLERASAVMPDFKLTQENAPNVVAICTRLDGLPLAIELAAAQSKALSPSTMLSRLDRRLAALTRGPYDLPVRHQTLRAAIDWSYDLLTPEEQVLFARLSVFAGGSSLAAVETVASPMSLGSQSPPAQEVIASGSTSDLLKALLDKSLLQQTEGVNGEPRYHMLETIREHSSERLEASGEADDLQLRHANYYLDIAEEAEPHLNGQERKTWLDHIEQEHDNLRAALEWTLSTSHYDLAGRIAGALRRFWDARGYWSEGRRWLHLVLANSESLTASVRANAAMGAGRLAYFQDDNQQAQTLFEESLSLYRQIEDKHGLAEVLSGLAYLAARQGKHSVATDLLEESLSASRDLGDAASVARTLGNLSMLAIDTGDYERAERLQRESLAMFRSLNDRWGTAVSLEHLGQLAAEQANFNQAISLLEESLALNLELGEKGHTAWVLGDLGIATLAAGEYERSLSAYEEASRLFLDLGDKSGWAISLFMRGLALAYQGHLQAARSSFKESIHAYLAIQDQAGCAPAIDGLAFVAVAANNPLRAATLAGIAEMLRGETGYRVQLIEQALHERTLADLRAVLEQNALAHALLDGRTTSLHHAFAFALEN